MNDNLPALRIRRIVMGAGLLVALAAAYFLFFPNAWRANLPAPSGSAPLVPSPELSAATPTLSASAEAGRPNPHVGPMDAPVTIVEFGDFACTSCRTWAQFKMRQTLIDTYGEKIRIVWADFPAISLNSPKAAEAGRCAYDQNKFWEYQDYVYDNYAGISVENMKTYASAVGLNREVFDKCLDSGIRAKEVRNDWDDANVRRITGTPTFFINEQRLVGLATPAMFAAILDPILAKLP
jgi:protein-disulfide isomerase